jgi:hypothetical protein
LKRAGVPYFRLYDLRSTYATRLSARRHSGRVGHPNASSGQLLSVPKYSQMKLQMKREALDKINRRANEMSGVRSSQLQRFANSPCPVCTHHVSFVLNNLGRCHCIGCAHLQAIVHRECTKIWRRCARVPFIPGDQAFDLITPNVAVFEKIVLLLADRIRARLRRPRAMSSTSS